MKVTLGLALVRDIARRDPDTGQVVWCLATVLMLWEPKHRGSAIGGALTQRRGHRRFRRFRLRYRPARFDNRRRPEGWLAPSLQRRVETKRVWGFQTGDTVKALVTTGKKMGLYLGRVAVRASGSFDIKTASGLVQGISHRFCTLIQRAAGYGYSLTKIALEKGVAGRGQAEPAALSRPGLKAGASRAI